MLQIEECEEEEILLSDEDGAEDEVIADRPVTPTPIQDFAANVSYKEGITQAGLDLEYIFYLLCSTLVKSKLC